VYFPLFPSSLPAFPVTGMLVVITFVSDKQVWNIAIHQQVQTSHWFETLRLCLTKLMSWTEAITVGIIHRN
jgi:hypothetical protein